LERWNTIPTRRRTDVGSLAGALTSSPSSSTRPLSEKLAITSFMRLKQRRIVDLPQPEGPMKAVTPCAGTVIDTSRTATVAP
jgi:hypothetical protein